MIEAELFKLSIDEDVVPAAEIDAAVWVDPFGPIDLPLAPFTLNVIIPMYVRIHKIKNQHKFPNINSIFEFFRVFFSFTSSVMRSVFKLTRNSAGRQQTFML